MKNPSNKQQQIGRIVDAIRGIKSAMERHSKELMKSFRITGPQLGALLVVDRYPEISMSELSRRMYLHISTVSGIVDRLKKAGYLFRDRSIEDRRKLYLSLTPKGKKLIGQAPRSYFGTMVIGLNKLPDAEVYQIGKSMEKLIGIMGVEDNYSRMRSKTIRAKKT